MNEQSTNYLDNSFNPAQAYNYTLLVSVNATSFAYAILYKKKLLALQSDCPLAELTQPDKLKENLTAEFRKVVVALPSTGFTLVPTKLFNAGQVTAFARLLDVKENEKVLAKTLNDKNCVVYKVEEELLTAVNRYELKNVVFGIKGLLKAIAKNYPYSNYLYLNFENDVVDIIYFKDGELRFYNNFNFKGAADVVYFATLVAQEVSILPAETTIVLSGLVLDEPEMRKHLTDFFSNVIINHIQLLELPAQINAYQILPLAALSLCESSEAY